METTFETKTEQKRDSLQKVKEEFWIVLNETDIHIKKFEKWIDDAKKKIAETKKFADSLMVTDAYKTSSITVENNKVAVKSYLNIVQRFINENPLDD